MPDQYKYFMALECMYAHLIKREEITLFARGAMVYTLILS